MIKSNINSFLFSFSLFVPFRRLWTIAHHHRVSRVVATIRPEDTTATARLDDPESTANCQWRPAIIPPVTVSTCLLLAKRVHESSSIKFTPF